MGSSLSFDSLVRCYCGCQGRVAVAGFCRREEAFAQCCMLQPRHSLQATELSMEEQMSSVVYLGS